MTLPGRLPGVLGAPLGVTAADVRIEHLRALRRSPARSTWAFDAVTPFERRALILHIGHTGRGYAQQAQIQAAAAARGVPVPHTLAADDSAGALGGPFQICETLPGDADYHDIAGRLDDAEDGRAGLLRQCAHALTGIHRIDVATPESARWYRLSICRRALDGMGETTATFEWAARWLCAHEPTPAPARLVHGDYRMGNLLVDGTDLTGVLDWEWVHVGEASEDLAWFCMRPWRFGAPAGLGAGGLGSIESFLDAYEKASGTAVDRVGFHWWRIMTTLFRGVMCLEQAHMWLKGKVQALPFALVGRRVCESEWDLLNLIEGTELLQ